MLEVEWKTEGETENECQEHRILNDCSCCSDGDLCFSFGGVGGVGKETKYGSKGIYICKQIFHPTVAENFHGNSECESIHQYVFTGLLDSKVKLCSPVPPVSRV